jgi:hypothetical protein
MSSRRLFFANIPKIAFRKTCGEMEARGKDYKSVDQAVKK